MIPGEHQTQEDFYYNGGKLDLNNIALKKPKHKPHRGIFRIFSVESIRKIRTNRDLKKQYEKTIQDYELTKQE
jgi:hypothetical protein